MNTTEKINEAEVILERDSYEKKLKVFFTFPDAMVSEYIFQNSKKFEHCLADAWEIEELFELIDDRLKNKLSRIIQAVACGDAKSTESVELAFELIDKLKLEHECKI
ncbi:MAG: hypothetical protein OHK0045_22700 [Raineya sp.]